MIYKIIINRKILRYLKILINRKTIIIFCISAIISNYYILYVNNKYIEFYKKTPNIMNIEAVVVAEREEKEYSYKYIIKVKNGIYKGKKFILSAKKDDLKYGDLIEIKEGEYIAPLERRNYKGFDYREYLKTKKIFGTIKANNNKIQVLKNKQINPLLITSNKIRNSIIENIKKVLPDKTNKLLAGILLGNKSEIQEEIIEDFKTSNLSHMLAVSGAHTSYVILGLSYILNKSKISKKYVYVFTIIALILFMFITNFTVSVIRACLMGNLVIASKLFYKKADFINNICIALLVTLIYNPFSINEIGLQLSYLGTIGIVFFNKNMEKLFNTIKFNKKISKLLSVTFSAQIMIMPIMAYKLNTLSLTFFISNILATPFLGITIILGFITVFISFISYDMAKMLAIILNISLEILINITHFTSKIPLSKILIKTPFIFLIISIYIIAFSINYVFTLYRAKKNNINLRLFQKKIIKLISLKNIVIISKIIATIIILFLIFSIFSQILSQNLKIYFIDVGQGDTTLLVTPNNKKILIDGGEGKTSVLLDYLLDRRIKKIDYVIISHFDSDHCQGLFTIMKESKVKNVIIGKQFESCENYQEFLKIVKEKKIKVHVVEAGQRIKIEKNLYFDVLWPSLDNVIQENSINNNSLVCKLVYKDFSMLFVGDIEEIAEKAILEKYQNKEAILQSTILKVAHHRVKIIINRWILKYCKTKNSINRSRRKQYLWTS